MKNGDNMMHYTGSSNLGHGLCCKPDYKGQEPGEDGNFCDNSNELICSEPSGADHTNKTFEDILTLGKMNY